MSFEIYCIDDDDIQMFTEGDCHILAWRIHLLTGWPMCAFRSKCGPDIHACVRVPDGRYLDINGLQTGDEMKAEWSSETAPRPYAARTFRQRWEFVPYYDIGHKRAKELAPYLIGLV